MKLIKINYCVYINPEMVSSVEVNELDRTEVWVTMFNKTEIRSNYDFEKTKRMLND